jgi:hypothetical protein
MALTRMRRQSASKGQAALVQRMPLLKKLFWAYFLLLFFEGALRKWLLPQYSGPLLLVRDPIAILIIWEAYRTHKWPRQWSATIMTLTVGLLALCFLQVAVGENVWFIALFGLRSYLLPFPVAFIMGENLDSDDLRKFATWTLWLLFPLTALEVLQYNSSPTSFWNAASYRGTEQLAYSAGHVRASATFSYVTGPMGYLPLAAAFIFYGLATPKLEKRKLLWAASGALVLAIPLSGSRTIVFMLAAVLGCVGIAALFGVSQFVNSLQLILGMLFVALLVSRLPVFSEASDTLVQRFTESAGVEGGTTQQSLLLRVVDPVTATIEDSLSNNNWLGRGMGYGSSAIAQLVTGQATFLLSEVEFPRVVGEFGWPGGFAFMLFRWGLELIIIVRAIGRTRQREPLALLLIPVTLNTLANGTLEQPTVQGFMVMSIAFSFAAIKKTRASVPAPLAPIRSRLLVPVRTIRVRSN